VNCIEGSKGWIVVDPLTSRESAAAAIAFAREHLGSRPVSAIIFTHSHIGHCGGVFGVISPQEVAERKIPVIAPDGVMAEATSENVMVGTAMGRRQTTSSVKILNAPPGAWSIPAWAGQWRMAIAVSCRTGSSGNRGRKNESRK
jgi:alkyl sulfatase BDS1-like metallo-beta-lactamase superfamily hydrolase